MKTILFHILVLFIDVTENIKSLEKIRDEAIFVCRKISGVEE